MKILIIEDDNNINNMLKKLLTSNGYEVVQAFSGTEGILLHKESIALILLDLMLPGKNGEEIIFELKKKKEVPIIVMSAIGETDKKIDLFELGVSDYITKPFSPQELLLRIKVHLKKTSHQNPIILEYKDIKLNTCDFSVKVNNHDVILTKNEFLLLKAFLENQGQVLTKSTLFDLVWQNEDSADDNTLNVHISKLRNKLREANKNADYIETVWSIGYRLKK